MSVGEYQLINKLLSDKDYSIVEDNQITEEYLPRVKNEFNFIKDFYEKYNSIPDKEKFLEKFPNFEFFIVTQTPKSIIDDLREQALFYRAVNVINTASRLYEKDSNEASRYLLSQIDSLQPQEDFSCTDIIHDRSRLEEWKKRQQDPNGSFIEIPFKELNEDLLGFQRGEELFFWIAKSNIGKSAVLTMCAEHASKLGNRVGFISPEMSKQSIGFRWDSSRTHFSNSAMQKGLLINGYEKYFDELNLTDEHVFVADSEDFKDGITVSMCRQFVKSKQLDILFIDGIVYIDPDSNTKGMSTSARMGLAARQLLKLSNDFKIPVVAVAQSRRRGSEKRSEDEILDDAESIADSYDVSRAATKMVSINKSENALKFYIPKNRGNIAGKSYTYSFDMDRMTYTFIPSLENIESNEETAEELEELKKELKHVF
nr:MAG TPA: Helicase REPLICATION [Caudoviricetes sp.]